MGNSSSTSTQTALERFTDTTKYITHPLLQQRIESISQAELQSHLANIGTASSSMSRYWIVLLEEREIYEWNNMKAVVAKAITDMAKKRSSYTYVEAMIEYIVHIHKKGLSSAKGIDAIIELATAVAKYAKYRQFDKHMYPKGAHRLHHLAADAIKTLDLQLFPRGSEDVDKILDNVEKGLVLFDKFDAYKEVEILIQAKYEKGGQSYEDYTDGLRRPHGWLWGGRG